MVRQTYLLLLIFVILLTAGCGAVRRDRCYLPEVEYMNMRTIFETTGSYQRVAQAMEDDQWAACEINSFRYRLRKDFGLDGEEYDVLFIEEEPDSRGLDYNPGRVEDVP